MIDVLFSGLGGRGHHWVCIDNIYAREHTQVTTQLEACGDLLTWIEAYGEAE